MSKTKLALATIALLNTGCAMTYDTAQDKCASIGSTSINCASELVAKRQRLRNMISSGFAAGGQAAQNYNDSFKTAPAIAPSRYKQTRCRQIGYEWVCET